MDWSGSCSWCGKTGDATTLFCYSAATGELDWILRGSEDKRHQRRESQHQFCSAEEADCLDLWLRKRNGEAR
jgi:hypothetical protein